MRSRERWWLGSAMGVLLWLVILFTLNRGSFACIANGFGTIHFQVSGGSSSVAALPTLPQLDSIACLADAAWSADRHFIAVLRYQDCPKDSAVPGLVDLSDVYSGRLIRQLHPEGAIVRRFNDSLPAVVRPAIQKDGSGQPVIDYEHIIWSPDGQCLAFTFAIAAQQPSLHGVVLMNGDGGSERVLLQQQPPSGPFYTEWDLLSHPVVHPVPALMTLPQKLCSAL